MNYKWRIRYEDGSVFDDSMGRPEDAPIFGVICITNNEFVEGGRNVALSGNRPEFGESFFVFDVERDRWFCYDLQGLFDWSFRTGLVKWGRYTTTENYKAIVREATHDPDFPKKVV